MSSIKCPQCGLVNFADAEKCKRCDVNLSESVKVAQEGAALPAQSARKPNLFPCPDCEHMISRSAQACPQCGRFIQRIETPAAKNAWSSLGLLAGLLVLVAMILGVAGLATLYSPERIVGGDAFNYIIAGSRGTGLLILGLGVLILGVGLDIRSEIVRSRN